MTGRMLIAAGMICLVVGCGKKPEDLGGQNSPTSSDKDNKFLATATEANMTEIQTGKMCDTMSTSPEVKAFGKMLVEDHTKATAEVAKVAAAVGAKPPTELDSDHKDIIDGLTGKMGEKFDEKFLKEQIKAHKDTLEAASDEAEKGTNPQVKALAASLVPTLTEHLTKAQSLKEKMDKSSSSTTMTTGT